MRDDQVHINLANLLLGNVAIFIMQNFIVFGVQIILARLLEPSEFGLFAVSAMLSTLMVSYGNLSGDKFLIRNKKKDEVLNTVIYLEFAITAVVVLLAIALLPFIASFVKSDINISVVQALMLGAFYNPFVRPRSYLEKDMKFYKVRLIQLASFVVGGVLAVYFAYIDYGIWALVAWRLTPMLIEIVFVSISLGAREFFSINSRYIRLVVKFCFPLLVTNFIVIVYGNVDYYILSYLFSEDQIGQYWMALTLSQSVLRIKNVINDVLYSYYVRCNDVNMIRSTTALVMEASGFVLAWVFIVIFFYGQYLIPFIIGDSWIPSVPIFKIMIAVVFVKGVFGFIDPLIVYYKDTSLFVKMSILYIAIMVPLGFYLSKYFGVSGMAIAMLLSSAVVAIISSFKLHQYNGINVIKFMYRPLVFIIASIGVFYVLEIFIIDYYFSILLVVILSLFFMLFFGTQTYKYLQLKIKMV